MRIVVSGTHASGKSTLISDFALRHPEFVVLPDPFELLDEAQDAASAASFAAQLRMSADRLEPAVAPENAIAERGPIDFLAYLSALEDLTSATLPRDAWERAVALTREAMQQVDLLVVLPLTPTDPIVVGTDEHPALRDAMNDALLDLLGDPDIVGEDLEIVEITGDRDRRLAALEALIAGRSR